MFYFKYYRLGLRFMLSSHMLMVSCFHEKRFALEHAAQQLLEQIQINPVIAAVCNEDELALALVMRSRPRFVICCRAKRLE